MPMGFDGRDDAGEQITPRAPSSTAVGQGLGKGYQRPKLGRDRRSQRLPALCSWRT